jgi:pimeloyl-ACP methyl ester carboxylesterase
MPRRAKVILVLLVVIFAALDAFRITRDPEHTTLDDAARKAAPGRFVRLSDGFTHYQIDGPDSGRVVVLAHGFSVPLYLWDSTASALSHAGFRVVRYDVFGRGYSDRPDAAYDDAMYDRQLRELMDSLKIAKADFAGVSAGGFFTGVFAGRHPERVRTLTLVDPVAGNYAKSLRPFDLPVVGDYLWQATSVPKMAEGQASDFVDPSKFPGWADRYRVQMQYKGFGRALLRTRESWRGLDMDTVYKRVAAGGFPVMLIWGREDKTVPFVRSAGVLRDIPMAEFHPVDGVGHLPILETARTADSLFLQFYARHN